jgi:fluoroquinolone transport system permease protein
MRASTVVRALGPIDLKNIARDSLLRWIVGLPIVLALLIRWATPMVAARLRNEYAFDLVPYYPLLVTFVLLISPMLAGMVIGFLLLDQRDDRTLTALQVTPLSLTGYLVYRMAVPMLAGIAITMVAVPLCGLVPIGVVPLLVTAVAAAPLAPVFALFLGAFAANKVQGFALMKVAGIVNWPPIIAYFLPTPWQWLMGIIPTYWPAKLFWMLEAGQSGYGPYLAVGVAYSLGLSTLLVRRFKTVMHR